MSAREQGCECGSASEVIIVTPLLIMLLLLVLLAGRVSAAKFDVTAAARDAARAGSLRASGSAASADAETTAASSLSTRGMSCRQLDVSSHAANFRPGGSFGVTVTCTADLSDLALLEVPGSKRIQYTAWEAVDAFGVGR